MNTTALILWQSHLQAIPADRRSSLLRSISPELAKKLQELPTLAVGKQLKVETPEEELSKIHFSWLAPFLRSLPENEIKLFVSSLTPEQIQGLKQSLLLTNSLPSPSAMGSQYLKRTLYEAISDIEDLLPSSYLPEDPLNDLLELTREELDSLIDLLSMHDLSVEIRHIIETTKLKEIYNLLSKAQTTFLKTLLHKKEPVSFKKMGLLSWKGDREQLMHMLLQRGINRIAKSLYGKNPSLLWHIAHRLDVDKGQLLMKLCSSLDHPRASSLLADQVAELIHALKSHNPAKNL